LSRSGRIDLGGDSRAGDPDLTTHVAVANKVQTLDGRWLSIRRSSVGPHVGGRLGAVCTIAETARRPSTAAASFSQVELLGQ
jgi:TrwC relaxase